MVSHSDRWLTDETISRMLRGREVVRVVLAELQGTHDRLVAHNKRRIDLDEAMRQLTELIMEMDTVHDRMARAVHGGLTAVITGTRDAKLARRCIRLLGVLFPEGLGITRRSYIYEAGAVTTMKQRVTAEHKALMASLTIGKERLLDWYEAWVEAGEALGRHAHEREHLVSRSTRGGSGADDLNGNMARQQWIAAVHTFISVLDLAQIDDETRELILGPLERSIEAALQGKDMEAEAPADEDTGNSDGEDGDAGDELDGDTALDGSTALDASADADEADRARARDPGRAR